MAPMDDAHTTADAFEASALSARELREDGDHAPAAPPPARKPRSPAEWAFVRVVAYLKSFEDSLDEDHEAAMGFAGGPDGALRIRGVGYSAPDLVTFACTDRRGAPVQLIQHVSQLNVALRASPKPGDAPPYRIGFRLARALEAEAAVEAEAGDGDGAGAGPDGASDDGTDAP